ncbi:MAG: hypothetical protein M4579_004728 [Chaenotheca gracillima]|nr:MAG: hypothetical protein M4579_004728 [Chaenotheca gracillima]
MGRLVLLGLSALVAAHLLVDALPTEKRESIPPPPDDAPVNKTFINTNIVYGWIDTPNSRGTWDILANCVFTLGLCVFTAIHLNVGPEGQTESQFWVHKCKWVLIAIFAPELVLYTAGKQWFSATRLCKKLNKWRVEGRPEVPKSTSIEKTGIERSMTVRSITSNNADQTEHYPPIFGYFVVMGGFIVDVSHLHNTITRLTITPKGVAFLARHGHFLVAPVSAIRDKSKADILAKGLVCFQVGQLLLQTIARKVVNFPITLLELHVLVHCFCAFGMYGLWFHKPLDVRDPTWVDSSSFEDLLALMLVRNYGLGCKVQAGPGNNEAKLHASTSEFSNGAESAYLEMKPQDQDDEDETIKRDANGFVTPERTSTGNTSNGGTQYTISPGGDAEVERTLKPGEYLDCGVGPSPRVVPKSHIAGVKEREGSLTVSLSAKDIRRWELASEGLKKIGGELHMPQGSVNFMIPYAPNIFLDRKGVHAGFFSFFCSWASGGLIAALVLCCFYGGIHALAWNFEFPSTTEHLLWRIASIDTIGGTITVLSLFSAAVYLHEHDVKSLWASILAKESGVLSIAYRTIVLIGLLNLPLFVFSRTFIVVESFIGLRQVPIGVYDTVEWTQYIPHF